jgi:hypothetical protein
VQVVLHALPLHAKPLQLVEVVTQLPLVLQVALEMVPLLQPLVPHEVLAGTLHVPAPSQLSLLQLGTLAVHSLFGSLPALA